MSTKTKLVPLVAAVLLGLGVSTASAQYWFIPSGYSTYWAPAYGYAGFCPSWSQHKPPYFSYSPPVYYRMSDWVDCCTRRPAAEPKEFRPVRPLRIKNPYVSPESGKTARRNPSMVKPLRVRNPYVVANLDAAPAPS